MTPTTDERLASIIRSLTEVVIPHLPADASLAQEQVQLAIGHLKILRSQLDSIPGFESEELEDTRTLARQLAGAIEGGAATSAALDALRSAIAANGADVRAQLSGLNRAIERLVQAVPADGARAAKELLPGMILDHERVRVEKDRRWFLPYGFDTMEPVE